MVLGFAGLVPVDEGGAGELFAVGGFNDKGFSELNPGICQERGAARQAPGNTKIICCKGWCRARYSFATAKAWF
eukprot:3238113-Lingulodinium_polyedra.AAC.1